MAQTSGWLTNRDLVQISGAAIRTVAEHTARLTTLRLLERLPVSGCFRFRLRKDMDAAAQEVRARIEEAAAVLAESQGVPISHLESQYRHAKVTKERCPDTAVITGTVALLRRACAEDRLAEEKLKIQAWIAELLE